MKKDVEKSLISNCLTQEKNKSYYMNFELII